MMNVQFQNEETLRSYFAQLSGNLSQMQAAHEKIGASLKKSILERFAMQSDPQGNPWPEWHPFTARQAKKTGQKYLLLRSTTMLQSLHYQATPDSVTVGFAQRPTGKQQPYAAFHEFGTKNMPRRGMVFADPQQQTLSAEDEQAALDAVQQYLRSIIHGD